jgi:hypothetical protein
MCFHTAMALISFGLEEVGTGKQTTTSKEYKSKGSSYLTLHKVKGPFFSGIFMVDS